MTFDWHPFLISARAAVIATSVTFFVGIAVARWMANYNGRLKSILDGIFISPLVLPPTVVGFILLLIFGKNGPIGILLLKLGTTVIFSWPATVIAASVVAFPIMYQSAKGAFEQVDASLENAARTLGASEGTIFWYVTVPLVWPSLAAGAVLTFARALGEFGATLMLAGNIPGKTQTVPIAIYYAVDAGNRQLALLYMFIIMAISVGMLVVMNYWKTRQNKFRFVR
jgi:molybdate transport system permease protein